MNAGLAPSRPALVCLFFSFCGVGRDGPYLFRPLFYAVLTLSPGRGRTIYGSESIPPRGEREKRPTREITRGAEKKGLTKAY
jgi:hypothetical protein